MPDPDYVSKTYTFVPGTDIEAAEVNQNFDDLVNYVNTYVVTRDGSVPFTGIPTVSGAAAVNPSSANQLVRKQYVDDQVTTLNAAAVQRLKVSGAGTPIVGTSPNVSTTQLLVQTGTFSGTTNASGTLATAIDFPVAFANGLLSVHVSPVFASGNTLFHSLRITTQNKTQFNVDSWDLSGLGTYSLVPTVSKAIKFNWTAVGW